MKSKTAVLVGGVIVAVVLGVAVIYYLRSKTPPSFVVQPCRWDSQKHADMRCKDCPDPAVQNSVARGPLRIQEPSREILYNACCPAGYEPQVVNNEIVCNKHP